MEIWRGKCKNHFVGCLCSYDSRDANQAGRDFDCSYYVSTRVFFQSHGCAPGREHVLSIIAVIDHVINRALKLMAELSSHRLVV